MGLRGPRPYLTDVVMDEVEDADEAASEVVRRLRVVARDGVVSLVEARWALAAAERSCAEVRDVVRVAEAVGIAQRLADNVLRGEVAESTRQRAIEAGLLVPDFRAVEPRDAA